MLSVPWCCARKLGGLEVALLLVVALEPRQVLTVAGGSQILQAVEQLRDGLVGWVVGEERFKASIHCSSAMACCRRSSGRWFRPLGTASRMAVHRMRPACRGRPLDA